MFGQEGGCNKTGFLSTCVLQNVKSYGFGGGGPFWANSVMFKKHSKNRYLSTFLKANNCQKMAIFNGY